MLSNVLLVSHTGHQENIVATKRAVQELERAGVTVWLLPEEYDDVAAPTAKKFDGEAHLDLVLVLGGDGTILRGARIARPATIPLLGVNFGKVGFLAERDRDDLTTVLQEVLEGNYTIDERLVLDVNVTRPDGTQESSWALNEASLEKTDRGRMVEVVTAVDGRPVSTFAGDGVVLATPTGSTAYAFSAGGPVVWPEVEALLMVPLCAHALFARPLVTAPTSMLSVEVLRPSAGAVLWCDGRGHIDVPAGGRVDVTRSDTGVQLVRLASGPFTDRLVAKFRLPVEGWRH